MFHSHSWSSHLYANDSNKHTIFVKLNSNIALSPNTVPTLNICFFLIILWRVLNPLTFPPACSSLPCTIKHAEIMVLSFIVCIIHDTPLYRYHTSMATDSTPLTRTDGTDTPVSGSEYISLSKHETDHAPTCLKPRCCVYAALL